MLKNKKATYILLPLVALIWGVIFYRIFSAANPDSRQSEMVVTSASLLPGKMTADTFSIYADYRDPFLGKTVKPVVEKPKAPVVKKEKPKPEVITWPTVIYRGMVKNQKSNKQLALVSIGGQDNVMREGDVIAEVELKKLTKDSIQLAYKKEVKYFKK